MSLQNSTVWNKVTVKQQELDMKNNEEEARKYHVSWLMEQPLLAKSKFKNIPVIFNDDPSQNVVSKWGWKQR